MEDHAVSVAEEYRSPFRSHPFPLDLVYIILDQLRHDKPSLASCVLVSRDWFRPARAHLFRNILIGCSDKLLSFIEFLRSEPNTIRDLVRGLHITSSVTRPICEIDFHTIRILLSHLPAVVELKLSFITLVPVGDDGPPLNDLQGWIPRPMKLVQFSHNVDFSFPVLREVYSFYSLFSTVETMLFAGPLSPNHGILTYDELTSFIDLKDLPTLPWLQVQELIMDFDTDMCFIEFLRRSGSVGSLRVFDFLPTSENEFYAGQALINDTSTLTHVRYYPDFDDDVPSIDLSQCRHLQLAYLRALIYEHSIERSEQLFQTLLQSLSHLPPTIKSVVLDFKTGRLSTDGVLTET